MDQSNKSFDNFFKNNLNQKQQKVVTPKDGILHVCAGAGSGKTRTITARIANLIINHNVAPESIVALTFTNKAANEMKERINHFLINQLSLPYIGTFHSYCFKLLKSNPQLLNLKSFSLIDEGDQNKLIRKIIQSFNLEKKINAKQIIYFISQVKNETLNNSYQEDFWNYNDIYRKLFELYEEEKNKANCLDFDDLLIKILENLQNNSEFKNKIQKSIRHILVDEYQDTNKVQHEILKAMTLDPKNSFSIDSLCVVGDEDQSIYSWRGADVTNIVNFNKDFPETQSITIEQNYRSVQPILNLANDIIKNNTFRNPKKLWSNLEAKNRIFLVTCATGYQEGEAIASYLKKSINKNSSESNAILYRSHFQSRTIEEILIKYSIPYKIIGGIRFYERKEIKDLLSYLKLIINPHDRIALSRAINTPNRGLGPKFEELLFTTWDQQPFMDFKDIINHLINNNLITKSKKEASSDFLKIFENLTPNSLASEALNTVIKKSNYYTYLNNSLESNEYKEKKENIKELSNSIEYFEQKFNYPLDKFLEEVALLQEFSNKNESEENCVYLMTLHAAKGLEFDSVVLCGLEEGILPSGHSMNKSDAIEEERRLLYVGITRAKNRLLITHSKYRYSHGQVSNQTPSRFITELSEKYISKENFSFLQKEEFGYHFDKWLISSKQSIKFNNNNNL